MQRDTSAVSPVLGVILLVAITVLLSATVYIMVGQLADDDATPAPTLAMSSDAMQREAQVIAAADDLDWTDLEFLGSCEPLLNGGPMPTEPGVPVSAGDVLQCESGEVLQIVSNRDNGNAVLYRTSFT